MSRDVDETAHVFRCGGDALVGILHRPARPRALGVLVVVGGPQYRIGSHRHFVELGRALSSQGIPVFRFDHRGIGDSEGDYPGFENAVPDIAAALDTFRTEMPDLEGAVLWGLCDAVPPISAAAARDPFVKGVVLLNPWAREEGSHSYDDALLRHYYGRRLLKKEFWRNLTRGRAQVGDFSRRVLKAVRRRMSGGEREAPASLAARTIKALSEFPGAILLVMSGHDITAREFDQEAVKVAAWPQICARANFRRAEQAEADHTFSDSQSKAALNRLTLSWLGELEARLLGSDARIPQGECAERPAIGGAGGE